MTEGERFFYLHAAPDGRRMKPCQCTDADTQTRLTHCCSVTRRRHRSCLTLSFLSPRVTRSGPLMDWKSTLFILSVSVCQETEMRGGGGTLGSDHIVSESPRASFCLLLRVTGSRVCGTLNPEWMCPAVSLLLPECTTPLTPQIIFKTPLCLLLMSRYVV